MKVTDTLRMLKLDLNPRHKRQIDKMYNEMKKTDRELQTLMKRNQQDMEGASGQNIIVDLRMEDKNRDLNQPSSILLKKDIQNSQVDDSRVQRHQLQAYHTADAQSNILKNKNNTPVRMPAERPLDEEKAKTSNKLNETMKQTLSDIRSIAANHRQKRLSSNKNLHMLSNQKAAATLRSLKGRNLPP